MRWLILILCLVACAPRAVVDTAFLSDEWRLETLNGIAFPAPVALRIQPSGRVTGTTPCHAFASRLIRFPPGWEFGPFAIGSTSCIDANAEAAFVQAIMQITRSEVSGVRLILTGPNIRMIFSRYKNRN